MCKAVTMPIHQTHQILGLSFAEWHENPHVLCFHYKCLRHSVVLFLLHHNSYIHFHSTKLGGTLTFPTILLVSVLPLFYCGYRCLELSQSDRKRTVNKCMTIILFHKFVKQIIHAMSLCKNNVTVNTFLSQRSPAAEIAIFQQDMVNAVITDALAHQQPRYCPCRINGYSCGKNPTTYSVAVLRNNCHCSYVSLFL